MNKKLIVIILLSIFSLCSLLSCGLFLFFKDTWVLGPLSTGCLYDDGNGFTEMKDGETIPNGENELVKCERGKLVFIPTSSF